MYFIHMTEQPNQEQSGSSSEVASVTWRKLKFWLDILASIVTIIGFVLLVIQTIPILKNIREARRSIQAVEQEQKRERFGPRSSVPRGARLTGGDPPTPYRP